MTTNRLRAFLLIVPALLLPGSLLADEQEAVPLLAATDSAALSEAKGKTVVVRGKVTRTGKAKATGVNFLNFAEGEFTIVTFGKSLKDFPKGEPADIYKNRCIEVRGEVTFYKDKPQIELTSPEQIRIVDEKAVAEAETKGKIPKEASPVADKAKPEGEKKPLVVDPKKYFTD